MGPCSKRQPGCGLSGGDPGRRYLLGACQRGQAAGPRRVGRASLLAGRRGGDCQPRQRSTGHRSLLVANRIILEAVEEGARGGGGGKRVRVSRAMEQAEPTDGRRDAWVGLLREMGTSDRDALVVTFRAIRGLLAQYDGWR